MQEHGLWVSLFPPGLCIPVVGEAGGLQASLPAVLAAPSWAKRWASSKELVPLTLQIGPTAWPSLLRKLFQRLFQVVSPQLGQHRLAGLETWGVEPCAQPPGPQGRVLPPHPLGAHAQWGGACSGRPDPALTLELDSCSKCVLGWQGLCLV